MKRYAFLDANGVVLNLIVGNLTLEQQQLFLRDHNVMYGAQQIIEVEPDISVWIGGGYTDGVFTLPPQPEPLPEVLEGESEVLPEPEATEPA
jgi:hypothetical protein